MSQIELDVINGVRDDKPKYIYYFYHHMTMSTAETLKIEECIKNHDFDAFLQFYYWYQINKLINPEGWTYFPDEIAVYGDKNGVEHISVFDRNNFNKITDTDCECG